MKNVSDEGCRENQNTYFIFNNFFFSGNRAVYDTMRKNIVQYSKVTDDNMAQAQCMLNA